MGKSVRPLMQKKLKETVSFSRDARSRRQTWVGGGGGGQSKNGTNKRTGVGYVSLGSRRNAKKSF